MTIQSDTVKSELEIEKLRMAFEQCHFGRFLLTGTFESQSWWSAIRHEYGNRWWHPWKNKTDLEIMEEFYKEQKQARKKSNV